MSADLRRQLEASLGTAYVIERELGGGGMSRVFVATETALERRVVVKLFTHELGGEMSIERFRREIKLAASLQHPHIVPLLGAGQAGGLLYYTMQYVEGESLRERLTRSGELPVPEAVRLLRDVLDALVYAHGRGVVHRDIKPDNILIAASHALVTDFGVAKALSAATHTEALTSTGVVVGTPAYMSPEQIVGDPCVDHRSDIYAAGILGYEMLAGAAPFSAPSAQAMMAAHVTQPPASIAAKRPSVPQALAAILMRCLEKRPSDRPQSAAEVLRAIESVAGSTGTHIGAERPAVGNRWKRVTLGVLVAAGIAALAVLGVRSRSTARVERTGAKPGESVIAVLPFAVRGSSEIAYLREGLVTLLSTGLNGAGEMRTVDPRALLGFVAQKSGRVLDPSTGSEVAARFGAGLFVLGDVVQAGDSIRISATLFAREPSGESKTITTTNVDGAVSDVLRLIDATAAELVTTQRPGAVGRLTRLAALTTHSLPALKAYLEGDQAFRARRSRQAIESFQKAVAFDSTFALAYYKIGIASFWIDDEAMSQWAIERALRHRERLSGRDQRLLAALHSYIYGLSDEAERAYRTILAQFPDDVDAWYMLGETLHHQNSMRGRLRTESREAFERVLSYEPTHQSALMHLARVAATDGRHSQIDSLLAHVEPESDIALRVRTLRAFAVGDSAERNRLIEEVRRRGDPLRSTRDVGVTLNDVAGAERLVRITLDPGFPDEVRAIGKLVLAHLLLAQGRWTEAQNEIAGAHSLGSPYAAIELAAVSLPPYLPIAKDELNATREALRRRDMQTLSAPDLTSAYDLHLELLPPLRAYLYGMLAARAGEGAATNVAIAEIRRASDSLRAPGLALDFVQMIQAQAAWHRGRPAEAIAALDSGWLKGQRWLIETRFEAREYERYLRAEAFRALGRHKEALRWYASLGASNFFDIEYVAPAHLRQAQIYEQLGQAGQAVRHYEEFLRLWAQCDPELRPMVDDARQRLAQLARAPTRR
ncbi:MAG: protein kinase domain-containing protein [Gemmatimonadaceae bacterium]